MEQARIERSIRSCALLALAYVLIMNAWASDDAFITFRTVRNLWSGHGLTWNPGWRVQAYTHPLWMFVAALGYGVSGECYYSVLAIAFVLTMMCGLALMRLSPGPLSWAAVIVFSASAAAMQYATSGLENPLLFLLVILYVRVLRRDTLLKASLLTSAIGLTRTDALVLVTPSLLARMWRERSAAPLLGLLPLIGWHAFSLVYYGIPYPNTAVAKLNVQASRVALLKHGLAYLLDSLQRDPLTLTTVGAALVLLFRRGDRLARAHAVGIALFLFYLVQIGGDFMTGRFIGAPFVLALSALLDAKLIPLPRGRLLVPLCSAAVVLLATVLPSGSWVFRVRRGAGPSFQEVTNGMGIADERAFYYRSTGLIHMLLDREAIAWANLPMPPHHWAQEGRSLARSPQSVGVHESVGFFGYFAEDKHVVDTYGLADPLLARTPVCINKFRIGHCRRALPDGYLASLRSGENLMVHRDDARLYDRVHALAVEPLFAPARWRAIACLNLGVCQ